MASDLEERGGTQAGEDKFCAFCDCNAYCYILPVQNAVCYDCWDTWLENSYIGALVEEETKCQTKQ